MKLGINLPQFGTYASPESIAQVAQEAERLGCGSVWVQERLLRPSHPRQPYAGFMDPWPESYRVVYDPIETLTDAAAHTHQIRLGTSVIDALYHSPVVLGRRLATLDRLSHGRLIAGLAQGWSDDEFEVVNVPRKRMGAGFEEFLRALLAVWGPDPVHFEGRFYRIPESEIGPKPAQWPRPPVLVGSFAPAGIQRAARLGLGWNPALVSFEMLDEGLRAFRAAAAEAGHDSNALPVMVRAVTSIGDAPVEGERRPLAGTIAQAQEDVQRVASLGVDHLFIDFYQSDTPPEAQLRQLADLVAAAT
jgi:probable F420-dependent oxidoreductase